MCVKAPERPADAFGPVRGMLLAIFLLGALGTAVELILLGHYEEIFQLIPLGLLTVSLTVLAAWFIVGRRGLFRVFRIAMISCLLAGGMGIYLHYQSNVEFELEMNPSAGRRVDVEFADRCDARTCARNDVPARPGRLALHVPTSRVSNRNGIGYFSRRRQT